MTRISFLGLGAMGRRMATRLIDAGHAVTVWNRSPQAAEALRALGARVAATPRAAATGADVAIAMVLDDAASRRVWLDPHDGALQALPPSSVAVESSTVTPAWIGVLAAAAAARGVAVVDAPVAGSRPQAEAGQLIFMAGGDAAAVARVRPLLLHLGGALHHIGAVGSGAALKLAVNTLFGTQVAAMAELLAQLRGSGVDPQRALEALRAMPVLSPAAAGAAGLMLAADYRPQAPIDLIAKDLGYALASSTQPLPLTRAVAERFAAARAAGYGGDNLVAVARLYP